jgi:hypothetical protein
MAKSPKVNRRSKFVESCKVVESCGALFDYGVYALSRPRSVANYIMELFFSNTQENYV